MPHPLLYHVIDLGLLHARYMPSRCNGWYGMSCLPEEVEQVMYGTDEEDEDEDEDDDANLE